MAKKHISKETNVAGLIEHVEAKKVFLAYISVGWRTFYGRANGHKTVGYVCNIPGAFFLLWTLLCCPSGDV